MANKQDPDTIISQWLECDLSRAAGEYSLAPAFEIDEVLSQIDGLLSSGRHLILAGDSGVVVWIGGSADVDVLDDA